MSKPSQFLLRCWRFFVDDGSLAAALVIWPIVVAVVSRFLPLTAWYGPVLAIGFVVILIENVVRAAVRRA